MSSVLLIHSCPHSYISEAYEASTQCFQHFGSQGREILDYGRLKLDAVQFGTSAVSMFRTTGCLRFQGGTENLDKNFSQLSRIITHIIVDKPKS